jgi:hypothetical protein
MWEMLSVEGEGRPNVNYHVVYDGLQNGSNFSFGF